MMMKIFYVGALLYLAVHHLLSPDCLNVRAKLLDLSMSSEIPNTGPDLRCKVFMVLVVLFMGWGRYLELGCSVTMLPVSLF